MVKIILPKISKEEYEEIVQILQAEFFLLDSGWETESAYFILPNGWIVPSLLQPYIELNVQLSKAKYFAKIKRMPLSEVFTDEIPKGFWEDIFNGEKNEDV